MFPIHGTCLGFQLLHILEANVSFTELLVDTDSGGRQCRLSARALSAFVGFSLVLEAPLSARCLSELLARSRSLENTSGCGGCCRQRTCGSQRL